jgi:hypothetical protein
MARSTGKKKASKSTPTTSTTPVAASDIDTPNDPKAPKTRPNDPKIKIKIPSQARNSLGTATNLPTTDPDNAELLARLAEQQGEFVFDSKIYNKP